MARKKQSQEAEQVEPETAGEPDTEPGYDADAAMGQTDAAKIRVLDTADAEREFLEAAEQYNYAQGQKEHWAKELKLRAAEMSSAHSRLEDARGGQSSLSGFGGSESSGFATAEDEDPVQEA